MEGLASLDLDGSFKGKIVRRTPLGRVGRPEDVAKVLRFLASAESWFMTGETLLVTGGETLMRQGALQAVSMHPSGGTGGICRAGYAGQEIRRTCK